MTEQNIDDDLLSRFEVLGGSVSDETLRRLRALVRIEAKRRLVAERPDPRANDPVRYCAYCEKQMRRKQYGMTRGHRHWESPKEFAERLTCNNTCAALWRHREAELGALRATQAQAALR